MSILTKLKSLFSKKTVTSPQTAKEKLEANNGKIIANFENLLK